MSTFMEQKNFEDRFRWLCEEMEISLDNQRFVYFIDEKHTNFTFGNALLVKNLTPDYRMLLDKGLKQLLYTAEECSNEFCERYNSVVDSILLLTERIAAELEAQKPEGWERKRQWFQNMQEQAACSFEEALQRILFLNQLLWQSGSQLVGLGKLDTLLTPYYEKDREEAREQLCAFLNRLHEHYYFKSNQLLGDTGQLIVVGGLEQDGSYFRSEITDLFLELMTEWKQPDPKLILRVSKEMPEDLLEAAVQCMLQGNGSPLLSNDDVIIPKLLAFGVEEQDTYQYTASACWEPLIGGKSSSMNNVGQANYISALCNMLQEERLEEFHNFDEMLQKYFTYLQRELQRVKRTVFNKVYQRNTLYSVFIQGCRETKKDIIEGGAKYHHVGITTVGFGNIVNALLNIKRYVFEEEKYSLVDAKRMMVFDYEGYEDAKELLKGNDRRYGVDSKEVLDLSNIILRFVTEQTDSFISPIGGKLKFGVSNPSYIMQSTNVPASFDGRGYGEPFIVHISNEHAASYTELLSYAAGLDYGQNRFNGNVVDCMVSPSFVEQNFHKFVQLMRGGIAAGFFQLQINVLSSDMLIAAKEKPEDYAKLIVRVWGFSAYFVELPESYQNVLIERALRNEGKL